MFYMTVQLLSLTLNEEHGSTVFQNKVMRKILQAKSEEVKGGCRKLHYTELPYCISLRNYSGDQTKEDEIGGACGTYRGGKKCTQGFGEKA
jgi:hypothetical protein